MPDATLEYRIRIRNQTNDADLLVLSSRAGDANCLLSLEPKADGQRIDWVEGTSEIGVVEWRAIDRDDGDDFRTITSKLADAFARNQMLSNLCIEEYSRDGGAWTAFHSGYLNAMRLPNAIEFTFTVGDTNRREQDAELFKFLTPTFGRGSYILGGPIAARGGPIAYGATPEVAFAGVKDFGPVRMQKVATTAGGTGTIALEFVGGYLRPYFDGPSPNLSLIGFDLTSAARRADEINTINRLARPWAVSTVGTGLYAALSGRQAWMDFPGLVCRLKRVSDGLIRDLRPVAVPTPNPSGDIDRLVVGENLGLYVAWPLVFGAVTNGTQFDVWIWPNEISEAAPLHWAGHPVDLVTQAWTQEGVAYDAASAASVKTALGDLWIEYRFTGPMRLTDLVSKHVFGPYGVGAQLNANAEKVMFLTRGAAPASVDTVTINDVVTDE